MLVLVVAGPAVVDDVIGAMVKSADVMVAPVEVEVVAPGMEVDAPGAGPPVVVFDKTLLLLLAAAATGAPVTTVEGATDVTVGFGTSVTTLTEPLQALLGTGATV